MKTNLLLLLSLAWITTGCGLALPEGGTVPEQYSLDGIKYITPSITNGNDSRSWLQETYAVSPQSRLLLRYEDFQNNVTAINVNGTNKVQLQITGASLADATTGLTAAQVCPVTRNWSPLATWGAAHPFGGGNWSSSGGDYDIASCVHSAPLNGNSLLFDVTQWFIDYPRGRGQDLGLILISDTPFTVLGENSGTYSPRFLWMQ